MNRSNTKPQEFKFSETRKNKMGSAMVNNFIMSSSVDNTNINNEKKKKTINIDANMP
jgi:hypothetical protein